ncbi:MAG: hypothetical protein V4525_06025 [Pseudomonadota bacterium]
MKSDYNYTYKVACFSIAIALIFIPKAYSSSDISSIDEKNLTSEEKCLKRFYYIYKNYLLAGKNLSTKQISKEIDNDVTSMKKMGCPVSTLERENILDLYMSEEYGKKFCIDEDRVKELLNDANVFFRARDASHYPIYFSRKMGVKTLDYDINKDEIEKIWYSYYFSGTSGDGKGNFFKKSCVKRLEIRMRKGDGK